MLPDDLEKSTAVTINTRRDFLKLSGTLLLALSGLLGLNVTDGRMFALPPDSATRQTVRTQHPRLILLDEDLARILNLIQNDTVAQQYYKSIKAAADGYLKSHW